MPIPLGYGSLIRDVFARFFSGDHESKRMLP